MKKPTDAQLRTAEALEEYIDRRIKEKLPGMLLELREKIDERFESQRKRRAALLTLTTAVAAGAIGFLGFRTYHEIRGLVVSQTIKLATTEFTAPETKRTINSIMRRALLDSYLTSLARLETTPQSLESLSIRDIDIEQLLQMLGDRGTSQTEFGQVVKVIVSLVDGGLDGTQADIWIDRVFAEFASLISNNREPKKTSDLLKQLAQHKISDPGISVACRNLVGGKDNSDNVLRGAAIYYAGETKDSNAIEPLIRIAEDKRDPLRSPALISLAKLSEGRDVVGRWADEFMKQDNATEYGTALTLVSVLWQNDEERISMGLLESCFKKRARLRVVGNRLYVGNDRGTSPNPKNEVPLELLRSHRVFDETVVGRLLANYLAKANLDGLIELIALLPVQPPYQGAAPPFTVNIMRKAGGKEGGIKIENGQLLKVNDGSPIELKLYDTEDSEGVKGPMLLMVRTTVAGDLQRVIALEKPEQFKVVLFPSPELSRSTYQTANYDSYGTDLGYYYEECSDCPDPTPR